MKRRTKIIWGVLTVILITGVAAAVRAANGGGSEEEVATVEVTRGDLVDKALAVGAIEPEVEIVVKSKVSGVVRRRFADEGEFVRAGEPLLDIRPDPTPLELVEARRQIELREIELAQLSAELTRQQALRAQGLVSDQTFESIQREHAEAGLQKQMATERLALLEEGRVTIEERDIESVVTSPIDGYILERMVQVGDPVVPLSTYQEGTELMTMADMNELLFRGTVDEIDVGRLREGMDVELRIGALPNAKVRGVLAKISLQGKTEEEEENSGATTFPVEIALMLAAEESDGGGSDIEGGPASGAAILRAGYSANADIIIARHDSVLMLPERVVYFDADSAWVEVGGANGLAERRVIRTGLSDAINIEVLSGLDEGDRVREKPARRFLNTLDMTQRRRVVMLGDGIKDQLFGEEEEAVGQLVYVGEVPFRVIGVMQPKTQNSSYSARDQDRIFIPATTYVALFGGTYVNNIILQPADPELAPAVQADIYRILSRKYRFDPEDRSSIAIWDTNEQQKFFKYLFLAFNGFLGVVGSFTLAVGGIGVANIMYVVVKERTREIGIRRSIGARRRDIMIQFIAETFLIVGTGAALGVGMSVLVTWLGGMLPIDEFVGTPTISPMVMFATLGLLTAIALLAGVFPARKAANLDPIECLRY